MAFVEKRNQTYIADTQEDLALIHDEMGSKCYVIKEGATYTLTSKGEWVKKPLNTSGNSAGEEGDSSKYATTEQLNKIQEAVTELAENPIFSMQKNDANHEFEAYGLKLTAGGKTLFEAIRDNGLTGFKTLWVQKGVTDLPEEMNNANQSGRGFYCCDWWKSSEDFLAWIMLFVKDGSIYTNFINHGEYVGWRKI